MGEHSQKEIEYEYTASGVRITLMRGSPVLPGKRPPSHKGDLFHTHTWYEFFCADRCEALIHFENERLLLGPSQFALISPDILHYAEEAESSRLLVCSFTVRPLEKNDTVASLAPLLRGSPYRTFGGDELCMLLMRSVISALDADSGAAAGSYLVSLLFRAAALCAQGAVSSVGTKDSEMGRIYKIEQALYSYYAKELPLSYLAERLHLSERQLSRVFKKQYGIGYREKNRELRMRSAARRLSRGESVRAVAAAVGYKSESAFYAAFKAFFGVSPGEYRGKLPKVTLVNSEK